MALHHVAVVGATGNIGAPIITALLAHKDHFTSITAVTVSSPEDPKFADLKAKGVHIVQAKFDDKHSLVHAFKGADAVISTVGGAVFSEQVLLIDAAIEAGVKRFVPSEFGVDATNPKIGSHPVFGAKVKVQQHLEEAAKHGKITYTLIATGAFADWGLKVGFVGFDLKAHQATFYDHGRNPTVFTTVSDIGKFTAAALIHHELSSNRALRFGSYIASQLEILQTLEKVGGHKWTIKADLSIDELKKIAQEAHAKGDILTFVYESLHSVIFSGEAIYSFDNYLFPDIRPANLEEVARSVLAH